MKNVVLLPDEEWLPVVGYEKQYMVSSYSRIYSLGYKRLVVPSKISKSCRYRKVRLSNRVSRFSTSIHRIAAIAFIPNPTKLTDVNHKDGDRNNNHISNFEWTSHRENVNHGAITKKSKSKFVGVSYIKLTNKWRARIYINKKHIEIGRYDTEKAAAAAYQKYCVDSGISLRYVA